jgi:hypothetical protein
MNWFENYRREYKLISASVAAVITSVLLEKTDFLFEKQHNLQFLVVVVFVIVIVSIGNSIIDTSIEKSNYIRKIIMGSHYIEGYYYDLSVDIANSLVKHAVLFKIEYFEGEFHVNGVTYDPKGHRVATWKSNSCTYQDRIIYIQYESHTEYSKTGIETGLLQLQFENPAFSYSGFYFDLTNNIKFIINGIKVDKQELKEYNYFDRPDKKKAFLIKAIQNENKYFANDSLP